VLEHPLAVVLEVLDIDQRPRRALQDLLEMPLALNERSCA
jgi:hypothetical protein